jgi:hypothetical protein
MTSTSNPAPFWSRNLTTAITYRTPLRAHLDSTFPNKRRTQARYKASAGPILFDGAEVPGGTLGTAFDTMIRLRYRPADIPTPALPFIARLSDEGRASYEGLLDISALNDPSTIARAAWAFAFATEVYRLGGVYPGTPFAALLERETFDVHDLLELATEPALIAMRHLDRIANESGFYKTLGPQRQREAFRKAYRAGANEWDAAAEQAEANDGLKFGARFATDRLIPADCDVIADGTLIEIKTGLGTKTERGVRYDALSGRDLRQLLAYVLLDTTDHYGIDAIGMYSARYGHYVRWPLAELLEELAGRPVDIAEERNKVWALLDVESV